MIFNCDKECLVNAINTVQKAVPTKTPLQILQGIMINAVDNNILKLTANDLELAIECNIEANIKEKGDIVVDAKLFGEIIRRMPDSEIHIETDEDNNVTIECLNNKFRIKGNSTDGFPGIPTIEKETSLKTNQSTIRDMIRQTIFAVGEDENKPVLTGTLVECKNGVLTFVSCDSYTLALRKCTIEDTEADISVIVPGKTLNDIAKILNSVEDELNIYTNKNLILFDIGNTKVVSRLLEGEYFKYESVIPEEYETTIKIDKRDLLEGIERVSLLISSDGTRFPITMLLKNDNLTISTNTQIGNAKVDLPVEINGNDMDIRFNPKYFIDSLKVIDEEKVEVLFSSDVGPCIIKSIDKDIFIYMILPLRK